MTDDHTRGGGGVWDLLLAAVLVVVAGVVLVWTEISWVLWALGVPFLLFLPGYAVVSALFPERPEPEADAAAREPWTRTPGWVTRVALSVVTSGIVVALVGLGLARMWALALQPAVLAIAAVALLGLLVAFGRRMSLERTQRASPIASRGPVPSAGSPLQNLALVVAVVVLVGSIAFVGAAPSDGEAFTEAYLLTEDADGEYVADDYPTTFVAGEGQPLYLGLENHEHGAVTYEVDVVVQEVNANGSVVAQQRLDRFDVELARGDRAVVERDVAPTITGEGLRLQFRISKSADGTGTDQTLRLWIDVVEPDA